MEKAKRDKKDKQIEPTGANKPLKYKQITVELCFADSDIIVANFCKIGDCLGYIKQKICERYTERVRIELF